MPGKLDDELGDDVPPFVRAFLERCGDRDPGSSAKSALCISGGLLSATVEHVAVDAGAAVEQRAMYLDFLGRDALEALVAELTLNIQRALGGAPLGQGLGHALNVSIDGGPWINGVRAGAVLTLGRHPRCGLQMAATSSFVSRLQCILVRARGRLVVYDMCSLNGTEACVSVQPDSQGSDGTSHTGLAQMSPKRMSHPSGRQLLVYEWAPGAELQICVRCESASATVRVQEPQRPARPHQRQPTVCASTAEAAPAASVEVSSERGGVEVSKDHLSSTMQLDASALALAAAAAVVEPTSPGTMQLDASALRRRRQATGQKQQSALAAAAAVVEPSSPSGMNLSGTMQLDASVLALATATAVNDGGGSEVRELQAAAPSTTAQRKQPVAKRGIRATTTTDATATLTAHLAATTMAAADADDPVKAVCSRDDPLAATVACASAASTPSTQSVGRFQVRPAVPHVERPPPLALPPVLSGPSQVAGEGVGVDASSGAQIGPSPSPERARERTCVICRDRAAIGAYAVCSAVGANHAICTECFVQYASTEARQDPGLVRQRGGKLLCPCRSAELGACKGLFKEQIVAALLPEDVYEIHLAGVREHIRALLPSYHVYVLPCTYTLHPHHVPTPCTYAPCLCTPSPRSLVDLATLHHY